MSQARKFGAFGGVFTPSILTILGVIMYLRLPDVVGGAGLILAIVIVLLAHTISITTGLSVSSIATDKRVKAGGSYYIISRSLGLPIGGTLGLALFVGLSFGVSLYVIGFSESFLTFMGDVDPATNRPDPQMIRLVGSVTLLAVTTITLISTSLAIKTQYLIMAAIVLSLISVVVGNPDIGSAELPAAASGHLDALPKARIEELGLEGLGFFALFGIFFPAVTGFEAGVSMSGDLKDPKRDIPRGTLAAIAVGFVVYIALAIFLAYRIPAEQLLTNRSVLLDYAWIPALVIAGIWGATISSALGSILGAPRILQACAADRIGPAFFAKGVGPSNEPRNALILTFFIAEAGILIGSLDVIAEVVSMFFMASYCVLNLSCAVESWASPDFRPDLKIPRFVSIIGAVTCIVIMVLLNVVAMLGAFAVMFACYVWLKRKQLALEGGDTWSGIWSSLVRTGLDRLERSATHQRNWRPNVLVFTGDHAPLRGQQALGESLIQQNGVLTEFRLGPGDDPARMDVVVDIARDDADDRPQGFFSKQVATDDVFATIVSICRFHGTAGMAPNTALLDWRVLGDEPGGAHALLSELQRLDLNVLISYVTRAHDIGEGGPIDVWWRGDGRNLSLGLALVRFLSTSTTWRQSNVRFIVASADPGQKRRLEQRLAAFLQDARIGAEVRVVDAPAAPDTYEALVARTSQRAELVFVALDDVDQRSLPEQVTALEALHRPFVLIRASSRFADPLPHVDLVAPLAVDGGDDATAWRARPDTLELDDDPALARHAIGYHAALDKALVDYRADVVGRTAVRFRAVVEEVRELTTRAANQIDRAADMRQAPRRRRALERIERGMIQGLEQALERFGASFGESQQAMLSDGLTALSERLAHVELEQDEVIVITTGDEAPAKRRLWPFGRDRHVVRWPLRRHLQHLHSVAGARAVDESLSRLGTMRGQLLESVDALVTWALAASAKRVSELIGDGDAVAAEGAIQADLAARCEAFGGVISAALSREQSALAAYSRDAAQAVADALRSPAETPAPRAPSRAPDAGALDVAALVETYGSRFELQHHRVARTTLEVRLRGLHHALGSLVHQTRGELRRGIEGHVVSQLSRLQGDLEGLRDQLGSDPGAALARQAELTLSFDDQALLNRLVEEIGSAADVLPETFDTLSEASFEALSDGRIDEIEEVSIAIRRLSAFMMKNDLVGGLRDALSKLALAVQRAANGARDVTRLVTYEGMIPAGEDEAEQLTEERLEVIRGGLERLNQERRAVEAAWRAADELLPTLCAAVIDKTRVAAIGRAAGELDRFIRTSERRSLGDRTREVALRVRDAIRRGMVNLSYRWSRGILVAQQLKRKADEPASPVERIIDLYRASTPSAEIEERLPVFYRQIFLGRAAADPAYQLPESEGLAVAARAIENHQRGHRGALWVTGRPSAGTRSLTRRIITAHFDADRTFIVRPPDAGEIDVARFDATLLRALGVTSDVDQALATLPERSVVVIQYLELWWERSAQGIGVVERIEALIERHGGRVLFVVTVNEYVMRLLRRLGRLVDQALATVHCRALEASRLRDAVLMRHNATGLGLRLKGESREPNEWKMARLFAGLFDYSGGYIGPALAAWIAHVDAVHDDHIVIRRPRSVDLTPLAALAPEWTALLVELVLHKRMGLERLVRVTGSSEAELTRALAGLERTGLVTSSDDGAAFEISRYMVHHVTEWLDRRGVI